MRQKLNDILNTCDQIQFKDGKRQSSKVECKALSVTIFKPMFVGLALSIILLFHQVGFGQSTDGEGWSIIRQSENLIISYKLTDCSNGTNLLLLKVENKSTNDVSLTFQIALMDNTGEELGNFKFNQVKVAMYQKVEGSCLEMGSNDLVRLLGFKPSDPQVLITIE